MLEKHSEDRYLLYLCDIAVEDLCYSKGRAIHLKLSRHKNQMQYKLLPMGMIQLLFGAELAGFIIGLNFWLTWFILLVICQRFRNRRFTVDVNMLFILHKIFYENLLFTVLQKLPWSSAKINLLLAIDY